MNEKYIPLYRKYRPKNLQEVVGQEHVKRALKNAIELNKISHAYLFTGPRGTGKTSIARILAKSLNCQQGPTITPCETCASCVDIKNSTPMDVIEIDAASNRKVEDARNILEKIQYIPVNGKYKIYIIDEVHMLTKEAFNTLLKTLEEPPENVIFILATTEPQKVLETIISRCQRFDFRRITTEDIVKHLQYISKEEKIVITDEALYTIAANSAGGMRDSLALLDQVSVLDNAKEITTEDINNLLGRLSFDVLNKMTDFIINSNPQGALEFLEEIYNNGNEPTQILLNMMNYFKNLLIVKNCASKDLLLELTQLTEKQISIIKSQSENLENQQITSLIDKISSYIKELRLTTSQHMWIEVAIIDLANLTENTKLSDLQDRLTRLEGGQVNAPVSNYITKPAAVNKVEKMKSEAPIRKQEPENVEKAPIKNDLEPIKEPVVSDLTVADENLEKVEKVEEAPMPISKPVQSDDLIKLWTQLLQEISSPPTVSLLTQHARPIEISEDKIVIGCKDNFLKLISSDTKKSMIEDGAQKMFGKPVHLVIQVASMENAPQVEQAEKKKVELAPHKPIEKKEELPEIEEISDEDDYVVHELSKKEAVKNVSSDQVSMVMTLFDGKYID